MAPGSGLSRPNQGTYRKKVFKGVQVLHPAQEKRTNPLQLEQLAAVDRWLEVAITTAKTNNDRRAELRYVRNRALLLPGFWRGFRGDELTWLHAEHVEVVPGQGMTRCFPITKGDRELKGTTFKAPALSQLCPVDAYLESVTAAKLRSFARVLFSGALIVGGM